MKVTVTGENDAPEITNQTLAFSVPENTAAVATITAMDPDTDDTTTFSIDGGADASLFQIDENTGALSFIAPPDFESPQDQGTDNIYNVDVRASDGTNNVVQSIAVTVDGVNELPTIATSTVIATVSPGLT